MWKLTKKQTDKNGKNTDILNGLGNVYRELVTAGSSDYVSTVEKKMSAGETKLNAIIEAFRSKQD